MPPETKIYNILQKQKAFRAGYDPFEATAQTREIPSILPEDPAEVYDKYIAAVREQAKKKKLMLLPQRRSLQLGLRANLNQRDTLPPNPRSVPSRELKTKEYQVFTQEIPLSVKPLAIWWISYLKDTTRKRKLPQH